MFLSAAKTRPWNSRCCSSSSRGDYFGFQIISRYWNLYKTTFVDNNDVTKTVQIFSPFWPVLLRKKSQKQFCFLLQFCGFFFTFWPREMTSKFKFDLIRPTSFGSARSFWFYILCVTTPSTSKMSFTDSHHRPFEQSLFLFFLGRNKNREDRRVRKYLLPRRRLFLPSWRLVSFRAYCVWLPSNPQIAVCWVVILSARLVVGKKWLKSNEADASLKIVLKRLASKTPWKKLCFLVFFGNFFCLGGDRGSNEKFDPIIHYLYEPATVKNAGVWSTFDEFREPTYGKQSERHFWGKMGSGNFQIFQGCDVLQ